MAGMPAARERQTASMHMARAHLLPAGVVLRLRVVRLLLLPLLRLLRHSSSLYSVKTRGNFGITYKPWRILFCAECSACNALVWVQCFMYHALCAGQLPHLLCRPCDPCVLLVGPDGCLAKAPWRHLRGKRQRVVPKGEGTSHSRPRSHSKLKDANSILLTVQLNTAAS